MQAPLTKFIGGSGVNVRVLYGFTANRRGLSFSLNPVSHSLDVGSG